MEIEAGCLIYCGRPYYDAKIRSKRGRGSYYFETVVYPGFADAHAHPQVVDYGRGQWRDSVEWIRNRELEVDEGSLRRDVELSKKLAKAAMLKSLLEGTTLIAVVGSYRANIEAALELDSRPRTVVMPTLYEQSGWQRLWEVLGELKRLARVAERYNVKLGLFCHSVEFTSREELLESYRIAQNNGLVLGLHLSEGRRELGELRRILGLPGRRSIVGIHCLMDEDYRSAGVRVVSCPASNLVLYGRTRERLVDVDALGTDWPLLLGGVVEQHGLLVELGVDPLESLEKATAGGYRVYGVDFDGDFVAYDEKVGKVLGGKCGRPAYVFVDWRPLVVEGVLGSLEGDHVEKVVRGLVREAIDRHPAV